MTADKYSHPAVDAVCPKCRRTFRSTDGMKSHYSRMHGGEYPFARKGDMNRPRNTHHSRRKKK